MKWEQPTTNDPLTTKIKLKKLRNCSSVEEKLLLSFEVTLRQINYFIVLIKFYVNNQTGDSIPVLTTHNNFFFFKR